MAFAKGISAAAIAPGITGQDAAPVTRTVYFGVIDADATNGHIVAKGGSMMVPPTTNPAFYTAVIGLIPQRLPVNGLEHYTPYDGESAVPPCWMPCFTVDLLGAATRALKKHGGTVVNGLVPSSYGRIMVAQDAVLAHQRENLTNFGGLQLQQPEHGANGSHRCHGYLKA